MAAVVAPAALALLQQATARAPERSRLSDGLKGDADHADRPSWHNPNKRRQTVTPEYDPNGVVLAVDLTHDPSKGCDAHQMARDAVARNDPRIYEAISQRRIWTRLRAAEGWRPYGGDNPHEKHCHLSLTWAGRNDVSPWWRDEEDDMALSDDDVKRVAAAVYAAVHKDFVAVLRGADQPSLKAAHAKLDAIKTAVVK